jgi:hypothetical protein
MSDLAKIVELSRQLEELGCAVVIFTEEELRGARADLVGDRLVELGWDVIDVLAPRSFDESGDE